MIVDITPDEIKRKHQLFIMRSRYAYKVSLAKFSFLFKILQSYFVYYRWKELIVTCDYKVLSSQVSATPLKLQDNMEAPTPKRRKNKIMTDECLIKLRQRYDEDRLDIPSFLKVAGPRCFQRPPKS
ncbi:unnamed protein product [Rotaria magnacalcarata]|uniref:Uncharacterized protein n=1 Tax=Rotaria magnacalcarata TaxID=392030 RepID=A0A815S354_9BILA|nr:unnamed protein product [Rotaria magnacalcarata]